MSHTAEDARRWMLEGRQLFDRAVAGLGEDDFSAAALLPGWTRRHLVAHVAGNAQALGNLVHWAASGVETPMYSSPEERTAGIEKGARMSAAALESWYVESATLLEDALDRLDPDQWSHEVRTVQGRVLPASEIPWLRARELMVHAVDLDRGVAFADLPADFLTALADDIRAKRGVVPTVEGPLADVTAWLAGRPHRLAGAPELGPWL